MYAWMSCDCFNVYLSTLTLVCPFVWLVCVAFRNCVYFVHTLRQGYQHFDLIPALQPVEYWPFVVHKKKKKTKALESDFNISWPLEGTAMQQFESDTICWAHTLPLLAESPGSGKAWAENRTKNQSRKESKSRERDSHGRALAAGCCITHKVHDFIFICCYSSYTRDPSSLLDSGELVLFSLLRFFFWQRFMVANFLSPPIQNDFYGFSVRRESNSYANINGDSFCREPEGYFL